MACEGTYPLEIRTERVARCCAWHGRIEPAPGRRPTQPFSAGFYNSCLQRIDSHRVCRVPIHMSGSAGSGVPSIHQCRRSGSEAAAHSWCLVRQPEVALYGRRLCAVPVHSTHGVRKARRTSGLQTRS